MQDDYGTTDGSAASASVRRGLRIGWWMLASAVTFLLFLSLVYAALRFLPNRAVAYDAIEEHFKYGSTGGEVNLGFPYWIWQAMPLLCADFLPADRLAPDYRTRVANPKRGATAEDLRALSREGYKSLGLIYEKDASGVEKDLPIGVSNRRNLGLDRVFVNCAVCHVSTVRDAPGAQPRIALGMPANLFNLYDFEHFFFSCANDERFNKHNVVPYVRALGANTDLADRYVVYPLAVWIMIDRVKLLESRLGFSSKQPPWGPGRVDTFSAAKAIFDWPWKHLPDWSPGKPIEDPTSLGTADFPSIWMQEARKKRADGRQMQLHWDGNNDKVEERNLSAAYGTGALPPIVDHEALGRIEDWLLKLEPPAYPYPIDKALATQGAPVYASYCADCHGKSGRDLTSARIGYVTPIEDVRTDRYRLDNYVHELAVNQGTLYAGTDYRFSHFRKTYGYANMPLDGIWLRAPYLHNGSVPTLRALLEVKDKRPSVFYRGNDVYDPVNVGFVSGIAGLDGRKFFAFDTSVPGNGNGGHEGRAYGTELPEAEKAALVEYLKTF
jgi:mono/diheme cytochrome c family protein